MPFTSGILWFGYLTSGLVYPNGFATLALLRIQNGRARLKVAILECARCLQERERASSVQRQAPIAARR